MYSTGEFVFYISPGRSKDEMALLGARCCSAIAAAAAMPGTDVNSRAIVGGSEFQCAVFAARNKLSVTLMRRREICLERRPGGQRVIVAGVSGGGGAPYRLPRVSPGPRRGPGQQQLPDRGDGPLMNTDIRVPQVRLLDEEQNMVGVVSTLEALQRSREADLDLVMISPDADPPVVKIMNYSKYRYEAQKKKREAQKKAAANRQVLKELKMRYNIDTHDYAVRQRAAQKFLKDGDKVKVVCHFKGREMDFKDLAVKLFQRFQEEIGAMATVETKISLEGKTMFMVLAPNKAAMQKASQSQGSKGKGRPEEKRNCAVGDEDGRAVETEA